MADPLSITASVVGIVVPALHGTRLLLEDLQQLKDAPKTWTKHSEGGKLSWQDQLKVGFLKQGQIKAMSEQLSNCRLAINSIVSIATLYSSVRHSHITEEIKKAICTKQIEVKDAISTADRQLVVLENKLEELNLSSDDDDDDDDETIESGEGKVEAVRQFEEELFGMKSSQKLLNQLLSKSQEEAVAKAAGYQSGLTTVTFGSHSSGFQAGIINGGVSGTFFGRN